MYNILSDMRDFFNTPTFTVFETAVKWQDKLKANMPDRYVKTIQDLIYYQSAFGG